MKDITPIEVESLMLYFSDSRVIEAFEEDYRTNVIGEVLSRLYEEHILKKESISDNISNINDKMLRMNIDINSTNNLIKQLANQVDAQTKLLKERQVMLGNLAQQDSYKEALLTESSEISTGIDINSIIGEQIEQKEIIQPNTKSEEIVDDFDITELGAGTAETLLTSSTKKKGAFKLKKKRK